MSESPDATRIALSKGDISLEEKLNSLPTKPGVYQYKDKNGELLYIGKASVLRNRVRQYFRSKPHPDPRIEAMIAKINDVELFVTDTEVEALILETTLIQRFKPKYNIDLKDNKSYPHIVITNEPYPRVFATRKIIRDGSRYFGPFVDVHGMHESLKMIRELYKVRSCNYMINEDSIARKKIRVCIDYHIKKCEGPCEGLVSREHYNAMIGEVAQIIKGRTGTLMKELEAKMNAASGALRFEEAALLRDKLRHLTVYAEKQKVVDFEMIDRDIVAVAVSGDDACGVIFAVRDGKIIGRQQFFMTHVEGRPEAEIVEQFLERFYIGADDLPKEIFLQTEIENASAVETWLAQRAGFAVKLIVPKIGDKVRLLKMCKSNAEFQLSTLKLKKEKWKEMTPPAVSSLQRDLRLVKAPRRIECFDISNIQGTDTVASMVVFVDGKPKKSEYRKFKIKSVDGPNDFASMREVIERRYTRVIAEQSAQPDLIMVDGGKGQLSSAVEVLERLGLRKPLEPGVGSNEAKFGTPIIGLAKRLEEVFVPGTSDAQSVPRTSSGLKLLQRVRDEAHRFAITYHRSLRAKRTLQTELDLIEGIGKKRAKELLEVFGSVQGVKFATVDQLTEIVGEKTATKIKEYFTEDASSVENAPDGGT